MLAIDYFDRAAAEHPDRDAVRCGGRRYSFRALGDASDALAARMHEAGFRPGSRAAVYAPNDARIPICLVAIMRAGGVWLSLNPREPVASVAAALTDLRADWLFYDVSLTAAVGEICQTIPGLFCRCLDELDELDESGPVDAYVGSARPVAAWVGAHANPDSPYGILHTGGTTGRRKAMMCDMQAFATIVEMFDRYAPVAADPVWTGVTPIAHRSWPAAYAMLARGSTLWLQRMFDPAALLQAVAVERITHVSLPPTALYSLLAHPGVAGFDYSSLRMLLLSGSPVSPASLTEAVRVFGESVCQMYGQIETGPLAWLSAETVAAAVRGVHPERLWSAGRPSYAVRLAVMGADGALLGPGERGEIVVRGRTLHHSCESGVPSAAGHPWHQTGDIGSLDEHGYLFISDRKQDVIISAGTNVFSVEVEAALMEVAGVAECAVIGVPDALLGEMVKAIVVGGDRVEENALIDHCKRRLGRERAPMWVEMRERLPRTPLGKVDKAALREEHWQGRSRRVN